MSGGHRADGATHIGVFPSAAQHAPGHLQPRRGAAQGAQGVPDLPRHLPSQGQGGRGRLADRLHRSVLRPLPPEGHVRPLADPRRPDAPLLGKDQGQPLRRALGQSFQPRTDLRVEAGAGEGPAVIAQGRRRGIVAGIVEAGHQGLHDPPRRLPEDLLAGQKPQITQGVDRARGQQVLDAGERVPGKVVGAGGNSVQVPRVHLGLVEPLAVEGPQQRHRLRRRHQAPGPLAAMAQGPLQVALLPRHPVGCEGDVEEAEVLGQLEGLAVVVGHAAGADAVADEGVPRVVVPRRDLGHPVADVLGGIRQQGDGLGVPGLQADEARQEEQERFRPVMGLGLGSYPWRHSRSTQPFRAAFSVSKWRRTAASPVTR